MQLDILDEETYLLGNKRMKSDRDRYSTPTVRFHHLHLRRRRLHTPLKSTNIFLLFHYFQPFIITLTLLSLLHLPSSSAFINGLNKDSKLLLSFKTSLPNSSLLHDWVPTNSPCDFSGVSCKNSRVSSLDLSNSPLNVDFSLVSSSLMSIQNLESLELKNANLSGGLVSIRRSKCGVLLNSVDLSENSISGSLFDIFSFGVCSSIVSVNLSKNSIDPSIKEDRVSTSRIQVLDLSYNNLSGLNVIPFLLSNRFSDLQFLSLKGNKLAGDVPLLDFKNLTYLDLSMNNFSTVFPSFQDCPNLQHLDLSSNKFFGDVGTNLSSCTKLNFLNLTNNQLTGTLPNLPISKNLQFLYLRGNGFQGVLYPYLSDLCSDLIALDLSFNKLSGTIPDSLGACSSLEILDLSSNNFSCELPARVLANMASLKNLRLSFNTFYGSFPESLFNSADLETLDLSSNNISGGIPSGICQNTWKNLQVLYLQNNLITGPIPESLSNCSQLISLDLSFNYLTGTIPSSLGSLSKIRDLIMWLNLLQGEIPHELMHLKNLENLILDFNFLNGSIPGSISNCTNLNWISLSNNQLTGEIPSSLGLLNNLAILKLANNSISGHIPGELGDCRSLLWVDINSNLLNGTIPPSLFKQSGNIAVASLTGKSYIYVKNDGSKQCHGAGNLLEFIGIRQEQLDRLTSLQPCNFTRVYKGIVGPTFKHNGSMIFLDLSYNQLEGSIPKELGASHYLQILNLGHNHLSGPIPQELGGLKNAAILDLSYNRLNGSIPQSLTGLTFLDESDLSNNNLSGLIPQSAPFDTFPDYRFFNNSGLCGYPLPSCGSNSGLGSNQHQKSHHRLATLAGSVAMGLLFALFCIVGLVIVLIETKKRRKKKDAELDSYIGNDSTNRGAVTANSHWKLSANDLSISVATFEKPLIKLTFADLLEATNNFHDDNLIGSGGFGDVYIARLKDGSVVAIKKLIHVSGQGDREFTAEMETIGKIKHRNLVPLLGYCKVGEERLLVYEYMKYGSLENVLRERNKLRIKLNWAVRRRIAIGAARGLAYLHHNCTPHIIHRDMKSSNVLVDENLEAKVSDFGMARLVSAMDTHLSVSTLAGTPGYVPPEYYQSFRCSTKGDVYSYGVVLLELLTGKPPTDSSDFGDNNIVGWVKQHDKLTITDVFDQDMLKDDPSLKIELLQHLRIACSCLDDRPWKRPTIIQVMAMFKEIQAGSGFDSSSTIAAEDGGGGNFSPVEGVVEMTVNEKHL